MPLPHRVNNPQSASCRGSALRGYSFWGLHQTFTHRYGPRTRSPRQTRLCQQPSPKGSPASVLLKLCGCELLPLLDFHLMDRPWKPPGITQLPWHRGISSGAGPLAANFVQHIPCHCPGISNFRPKIRKPQQSASSTGPPEQLALHDKLVHLT